MKFCQICQKKKCKKIINFGQYPVSHKFSDGKTKTEKFPLELGQCQSCGLVQLMKLTPVKKLMPKYEWITYNEPEEHLDHLSKIISNLPDINKSSKICGVSYKEDSLLARLNKLGFKNTWRMDMKKDLSIFNKKSNLETIQNKINNRLANKINKTRGPQDVIIVRHILEHTHKTLEFMSALKNIIKKNGYIIFEVPDCSKGFKINDYNTLWEEHVLYFTDVTFKSSLKLAGFKFHYFEKYNYPFESVLIGIVQPDKINRKKIINIKDKILKKEKKRLKFSQYKLLKKRKKLKIFLKNFKSNDNKIAIFGTGHAACLFVNLFNLKGLIDIAVDDNKKKIGYFIPGSNIPICSSKNLNSKKINLCILCVSSDSERKIIKKNVLFKKNGGIFVSIYPSSKYAI